MGVKCYNAHIKASKELLASQSGDILFGEFLEKVVPKKFTRHTVDDIIA